MTPEGRVKNAIVEYLKKYHVYYFFPVASIFARAGIPDIVCCVKGKFVAIECKSGNNKPTKRQVYELEQIEKHGGMALVINESTIYKVPLLLEMLGCIQGDTTPTGDWKAEYKRS